MKTNNLLFLLFSFLVFNSCTEENVVEKSDDPKNEIVASTEFLGKVPNNHPIMLALKNPLNDLQQTDLLYKKEISESKGEHYHTNLKHLGFAMLIKEGLVEHGSREQKLFYLEEQRALPKNLPNLKRFYELLDSCIEYIGIARAEQIADEFSNKNLQVIQDKKADENWKAAKKKELLVSKRNFSKKVKVRIHPS